MRPTNARDLRVWHYRRALSAQIAADGYPGESPYARHRAGQNQRLADFHREAVRILDAHPDCLGVWVEWDHERLSKPHSTRQKPKTK